VSEPKTLLVQTCHLPQFFYVAARLRERQPERKLEALMVDDSQARFYAQLFQVFDRVYFLREGGSWEAPPVDGYESVVLPLLNRGYRRTKQAALVIKAPRFECDFSGEVTALTRLRLLESLFRPLHPPTQSFLEYLGKFPHRPKGEKILLAQSCHRSLVKKTASRVEPYVVGPHEVVTLRARSWKAIRSRIKGQKFDSAVVFFSGEGGHFKLKLLPFLLRIPKILVVNENGHCFYASWRSLLRFLYQRVRHGAQLPDRPLTRVILVQTDTAAYVRHTATRLKSAGLFPESELMVFCRPEDRAALSEVPEIDRLHCLPASHWSNTYWFLKRIARLQPDVVAGIFSGRSGRRLEKMLFFAIPAQLRLAFNAGLGCYEVAATRLPWMLRREPLMFGDETDDSPALRRFTEAGRKGAILFIQTADDTRALEALGRLQDPKVARPAPILVFCREDRRALFENAPGVDKVFSYDPARRAEAFRVFRRLRRMNVEVVAALFTGEPIYRLQRLLYFLVPANNRLVFNGRLDCFYVNWLNFWVLFRSSRLRAPFVRAQVEDLARGSGRGAILLIQTADDATTLKALARLRDPKVARPAPILVLCRADKKAMFENAPGVAGVHTYDPAKRSTAFGTLRRLRNMNIEVVAGLFTGERAHRLEKLIFFLVSANHRLAFNGRVDCFYLRPSNSWRLLQTSKLRIRNVVSGTGEVASQGAILLVQTADDPETLKALGRLRDPKVARPAPIIVFCRQDKKAFFERRRGVARVYTYDPARYLEAFQVLRKLRRLNFEVVAALFTGESIYKLQKLLYFLVPANNRLVFNANLDCFYLARSNFWLLFQRRKDRPSRFWLGPVARLALKGALFLPRLLFLVIWVTGQKLKRAYSLPQ
jgi:ADP-heptose:LPS heptosyltransferase